jgi:hypothetical protein
MYLSDYKCVAISILSLYPCLYLYLVIPTFSCILLSPSVFGILFSWSHHPYFVIFILISFSNLYWVTCILPSVSMFHHLGLHLYVAIPIYILSSLYLHLTTSICSSLSLVAFHCIFISLSVSVSCHVCCYLAIFIAIYVSVYLSYYHCIAIFICILLSRSVFCYLCLYVL